MRKPRKCGSHKSRLSSLCLLWAHLLLTVRRCETKVREIFVVLGDVFFRRISLKNRFIEHLLQISGWIYLQVKQNCECSNCSSAAPPHLHSESLKANKIYYYYHHHPHHNDKYRQSTQMLTF